MRTSVAVTLVAFIVGATAVPLVPRDNTGVCNGPHTELTGGQCRDIAGGATGFMIDGQCLSIKLAGSSAYQNKSGKCYKRIAGGNPVASGSGTQNHPSGSRTGTQSHPRSYDEVDARDYDEVDARDYDEVDARDYDEVDARDYDEVDARDYEEVEVRDNTGVCNGPHTELTGGQCRDIAGGATGFMIDGQCISIKLAGSSAYQNKSGKCYKRIAGGNPVASGSGTQSRPSGSRTGTQSHPRSYQEVEARDNTGVCNGPHTELTGGQCRDIAGGATGFMIDGQCLSIKLAGSSAYQNKSGKCYKRIAGGNPVASGSGTQNHPSGSRTGTQSHPRSYQEVEARDNTGVCNGPHTELTGGQCRDIAGGATGFMIDGQCISIKLAGSSAYQNRSGQCYKRIAGGNPVASGSGTQSRPRTQNVRARSPRKL